MAIPARATRYSLTGTAAVTEIFDTSFWVLWDSPVESFDAFQALVDTDATIISAHLGPLKALIANDTAYTKLRGYYYDGSGGAATYAAEATLTSGTGTSGTGSVAPLQQCLVASLRTGRSGRSYRGRMYIPAHGLNLSGHLFTSAQANSLGAEVAALFQAFNDTTGTTRKVVVLSSARSAATPVTQVLVDNKPDIQRRRAGKFEPTYTSTNTVTP